MGWRSEMLAEKPGATPARGRGSLKHAQGISLVESVSRYFSAKPLNNRGKPESNKDSANSNTDVR